MWKRASALGVAACAAFTMTHSLPAEACGVNGCDGGVPGPMPVNQDGENVLFVLNPGEVEVHIQISIDPNTNAQKFAWLIPIAEIPEFEVGSQPLFDALLQASVPQYGLTQSFESCGDNGISSSITAASGGGTDGGFDSGTGGEATTSGAPDPVVFKTTAGAFEIVVLQDTTVPPIKQWLIDNDYLWIEGADDTFQEYLDEGNKIVALKLAGGADEGDVHPIVLRYPSDENCFPLRLTRFSSVQNMDIRVFLLGNGRAAPTNYRHVLVNPLKIDWLQFAANYKDVITKAVDELEADGLAFVTEYAGATSVTDPFAFNIYNPSWNESAFMGLAPEQVVNELNNQGLTSCYDSFSCFYNHPLVEGLLAEYLPPPDGLAAEEFYGSLATYVDQIDVMKWGDGSGFAAALAERIITPGLHAQDLLATWPYLTRMYTVISPNEMIADPTFHINPDLEDVANVRIADNYNLCDGNSVVTLPDEREIFVPDGGPWPDFIGEMFWAEEISQVALKGKPMHLVNNTAVINTKIEEWNRSHGWPRSGDSATGTAGGDDSGAGCGCSSDPSQGGAALLGLAGLGLLARRRRR